MENSNSYLSIEQLECRIGSKVRVTGTVKEIRNQGGLVFIDLKNRKNPIHALVIPDNIQAYTMAKSIEEGNMVEILGIVRECPQSASEWPEGKKVEIEAEKISIISVRSEKDNESKRIFSRSKRLASIRKKKKIT